MAKGQISGLITVFALGGFTITAAIVRMVTLRGSAMSSDPTWGTAVALIWTEIEANVSVICCCLPALRLPFLKLWRRIRGMPTSPTTSEYDDSGSGKHGFPSGGAKTGLGGPRIGPSRPLAPGSPYGDGRSYQHQTEAPPIVSSKRWSKAGAQAGKKWNDIILDTMRSIEERPRGRRSNDVILEDDDPSWGLSNFGSIKKQTEFAWREPTDAERKQERDAAKPLVPMDTRKAAKSPVPPEGRDASKSPASEESNKRMSLSEIMEEGRAGPIPSGW
jgi:hypothetical protein